jgi:hypothetical protein
MARDEQPQPQGQPRNLKITCGCMAHQPHTELEKEDPGSESGNSSVSGEGCFLEVMAEDLEHKEGLQQLSRKMGAIGECIDLNENQRAVLKKFKMRRQTPSAGWPETRQK